MTTAWGFQPRRCGAEGVALRHQRACAARVGGICSCAPSFQAQAYSARDRKTVRKTFGTVDEARAWRQQRLLVFRGGRAKSASQVTVAQAAQEWLERAAQGVVRTRSGDPYKPAA